MDQGLSAASEVDVELLGLVFIIIVSRVVGELILDARPRRAGVAATEWDSIYQVTAIHVALDATKETREIYVSDYYLAAVEEWKHPLFK